MCWLYGLLALLLCWLCRAVELLHPLACAWLLLLTHTPSPLAPCCSGGMRRGRLRPVGTGSPHAPSAATADTLTFCQLPAPRDTQRLLAAARCPPTAQPCLPATHSGTSSVPRAAAAAALCGSVPQHYDAPLTKCQALAHRAADHSWRPPRIAPAAGSNIFLFFSHVP
jgi:hypothetical protein